MRGGYPRLPGAGRRPNPTPPVVPSRYAAAKPTDVSRVAIALESVNAPEKVHADAGEKLARTVSGRGLSSTQGLPLRAR